MRVDGSDAVRLTTSPGSDVSPNWSPDGRSIAFASNRDGNYEIYVMNADGSDQRRLTRNLDIDLDPAWSPDGRSMAFTTNRDGNYEIYVMNADGSSQTRLTTNAAEDTTPDWQWQAERLPPPKPVDRARAGRRAVEGERLLRFAPRERAGPRVVEAAARAPHGKAGGRRRRPHRVEGRVHEEARAARRPHAGPLHARGDRCRQPDRAFSAEAARATRRAARGGRLGGVGELDRRRAAARAYAEDERHRLGALPACCAPADREATDDDLGHQRESAAGRRARPKPRRSPTIAWLEHPRGRAPRGVYTCVLSAGKTVVKRVTFRVS